MAASNTGAGTGQSVYPGEWYFFDNNGSNAFATANMFDTNLTLVGGRVYSITVDGDEIKVTSLHDADTPLVYDGMVPLLTLDLWEHAYYVDYRNERPRYAETVLSKIINWEFVGRNLDGASERTLTALRRDIGIIFQDHHLLPQCSALENVLLPKLAKLVRATVSGEWDPRRRFFVWGGAGGF